jgi:voltage-gated potassium channel Kch
MTSSKPSSANPGYPIGVTSRLTNIHPETLRIWERRYAIVEPVRASRGRRFYSEQDVRRLRLVKQLVDAGDPISAVAGLSLDALEVRVTATTAPTARGLPISPPGPCRVLAIGEGLPTLLREGALGRDIEIVACFREVAQVQPLSKGSTAEVVLWELPAIHNDATRRVSKMLALARARRAIVIYTFAARQAIQNLEAAGVRCLKAPVSVDLIGQACLSARESTIPIFVPDPQGIPPRRFAPEQLARIALSSPIMACECPHHLVDLVNSLAAFEKYSEECESRNFKDSQVHALLRSIAGAARALLETGLERVIESEGIPLD